MASTAITESSYPNGDQVLADHHIDLYISGHDHDLQHLEFENHPTSFVVSGGGGAELVGWTRPPSSRGPFGLRALGFTDLEIRRGSVIVRHIGADAAVLHSFEKRIPQPQTVRLRQEYNAMPASCPEQRYHRQHKTEASGFSLESAPPVRRRTIRTVHWWHVPSRLRMCDSHRDRDPIASRLLRLLLLSSPTL